MGLFISWKEGGCYKIDGLKGFFSPGFFGKKVKVSPCRCRSPQQTRKRPTKTPLGGEEKLSLLESDHKRNSRCRKRGYVCNSLRRRKSAMKLWENRDAAPLVGKCPKEPPSLPRGEPYHKTEKEPRSSKKVSSTSWNSHRRFRKEEKGH